MTCQNFRMFRSRLSGILNVSCRHYSDFMPKDRWDTVPKDEVRRFIVDCMKKVGTKDSHAVSLAGNLVTADYRGHYSHGLNRLGTDDFLCISKKTIVSI